MQTSKGFPNAATHLLLACELLASVMSPSDPTEQPMPIFDAEGAFFFWPLGLNKSSN